jgi:hypothetical protein
MYKVELTYDELLLLDTKVNDTAQSVIDVAKKEQGYGFDFPIIGQILQKSESLGSLNWSYESITHCSYCDKTYDYYKHKRSGRYHRKGEPDHKRPIHYSGVKFNPGFIRFSGYGDMCTDCMSKHKVIEQLIDYILDYDLKIEIRKNDYKPTKYKKDPMRICNNCGAEMYESEMGRRPVLMGGGTYPATCPHCKTEGGIFNTHKTTNKYRHILVELPVTVKPESPQYPL